MSTFLPFQVVSETWEMAWGDGRRKGDGTSSYFRFRVTPTIGKMLNMESVIRKVRDIEESERHVLEHVLGRQLHDNQQIIMQVVTFSGNAAQSLEAGDAPDSDKLPDWCNVYEGLTGEQIADLESVISERANLTRPS